MWSLVVGVIGFAVVAAVGAADLQRSTTTDERWSRLHHTFSFGLAFLINYIVPGGLAALGIIDDPLFGPGPTFPVVTALLGVTAALVVAAVGAVVVRRAKSPARRSVLIRLHIYMALTFLAFFTLPGLLADFRLIPDRVLGLGMAADLLFFFFVLRWTECQLSAIDAREAASAPEPVSGPA